MTFGDHLDELRRRLIWALALPVPLAAVAFFFSNTLIEMLVLPLERILLDQGLPRQMQVISPPEFVLTQLKLSVVAAIVLSAPWVLWQLWKFVAPGLYQHERRFVRFLLPGSAILTIAGVMLMYFIMLPLMLRVLILLGSSLYVSSTASPIDPRVEAILAQDHLPIVLRHHPPATPQPGEVWVLWPDMKMYAAVQGATGAIEDFEVPRPAQPLVAHMFRLSEYIGFVLLLFLGIVIAFQMPLVVVLLGWVGLASADWLRKRRKYAFFICVVVSILITPPDVISMLIMVGPLYGLYELGILLLVIAPASKVAEGSIWRRPRRNRAGPDMNAAATADTWRDKSNAQSAQTSRLSQTEATVAQGSPLEEFDQSAADGDKDCSP